jgi:regulator of protease activity HflC (stomatin/prohibitin superfamily)
MKNRIRTLLGVAFLGTMGLLGGCHSVSVDPGEEAVLVDKPYFAGHGGVRPEPMLPGRTITWLSTSAIVVSMVPQTAHVSFDDYSSKDNILLDFDTAVQLQITDPVALVQNFGSDWFKNNVQSQYAAMVREVVKGQTMTDMMSNPVTAATMDQALTQQLTQFVKDYHLPVRVLNVSLGRAKPNPVVLNQMNETAGQQQRLKTLIAANAAEIQRAISEKSRAQADDAYRQSMGYTTEQYALMQIANIQAEACEKAAQCIIAPPGASVIAGHTIAAK